MQLVPFSKNEASALLALAGLGFLAPNGVFIYCFVTDPGLMRAALANPLSLVFMIEAFFLMFLFAWLIRRAGLKKPSGLAFIILSLIGSLAFSVPALLYLVFKNPAAKDQNG